MTTALVEKLRYDLLSQQVGYSGADQVMSEGVSTIAPIDALGNAREEGSPGTIQEMLRGIGDLVGGVDTSLSVILAPTTSSRNTIQPTGDFVPLTLKSNASQSVVHLRGVNSSDVVQWSVSYLGDASFRNAAFSGNITSGTWQGSTVAAQYGGTGQSSYVLGDILYASGTTALSRLAGNTTTTKQFLRQTGTGSISAAPVWDTIVDADLPSTIVRTSRTISTTAPLSGGGDLSANRILSITTNGISNTLIRQSAALSVVGRSANSTGDVADISASASSGAVLRESGSVVGFGTVATAGIADDAITYAKMQNASALTVLGRASNSSGDMAEIAAGSDAYVLRRSGTSIGFGTIGDSSISGVAWSKISSTPTTLSGYGITDAVINTRTISTTTPLTGGGDLSANRTFSISGLSSIGSANQIPGTNNGATAWEYKTLNGTTNRVTISHAANSITWTLPQDIHTSASPTFSSPTFTGGFTAATDWVYTSTTTVIHADTSDGSDSKRVVLSGGGGTGSPTRGANFWAFGNEYAASDAGSAYIEAGNISTGIIGFYSGGSERVRVQNNGVVVIGNTSSAPNNVALSARWSDGVASGEHWISEFYRTTTATDAHVLIGYRANGSSVTGALIRTGNSLPLYFGTTTSNTAMYLRNAGHLIQGHGFSNDETYLNAYYNVEASGTPYFQANNGSTVNVRFTPNSYNYFRRGMIIGSDDTSSFPGWLDVRSDATADVIASFGGRSGLNPEYPAYIYFSEINTINFGYNENANANGYINYNGYQNGTTQFRDLHIADGKRNTILFVDGSEGYVGIGTTSPSYNLDVTSSSFASIAIRCYGGSEADLILQANRGTIGSPSDVTSSQRIGLIAFAGRSGSSTQTMGVISCYADGSFTSGDFIPSKLGFFTSAGGSSGSSTERMTIKANGYVGVGTQGPKSLFHIEGSFGAKCVYHGSTFSFGEETFVLFTGGVTGTLPLTTDVGYRVYFIASSTSSSFTVARSGSDVILYRGSNFNSLSSNIAGTALILVSDGAGTWVCFNANN